MLFEFFIECSYKKGIQNFRFKTLLQSLNTKTHFNIQSLKRDCLKLFFKNINVRRILFRENSIDI